MVTRLMAICRVSFVLLLITGCASNAPAPADAPVPAANPDDGSIASPADVADGYALGQGDLISIQVFDEPDLTMDTRIGGSGVINYSYLGNVQVAGKTPEQLEQHIASLLKNGYLVNPAVNVSVVEYRPFFIGGEVQSPGSYPYQPGLTLDKAITLAGGLTDRASTRKMYVIKAASNSQKQQRISLNSPVAPGDIIQIQEGFF